MSDSQTQDGVTVSAEGVTVTKRYEAEEFPVPAIAFEFVSGRDGTVTVRLRDTVPDAVAVDDLGFHPEYGSEYWTIEDGEIHFERELGPEESYTTVYGIRATGTDDVDRFLTEPSVVDVDPPVPDDVDMEEVVPDSDDLTDADAEEEEEESDSEAEPASTVEGDVDTIDLSDPTGEDGGTDAGTVDTDVDGGSDDAEVTAAVDPVDVEVDVGNDTNGTEPDDADVDGADASAAADGTAAAGGSAAVEGAVDGSLAGALAEEIDSGEVPEEDLDRLREALEVADAEDGDPDRGSVEARLDQVQDDVADLRAYTGALEQFLDEEGTGAELIEDARRRIDEFEGTVADLRERVEETEGTAEDAAERSTSVEEGLNELEDTVQGLESDLAEVRSTVMENDLAERLDDLEEDLADLREWQTQIKETFGG